MAGGLGFAGLGWVVWRIDRADAVNRRSLPAGDGADRVPVHFAAWAPALGLLIVSLLWQGLVLSIGMVSLVPMFFFGPGALVAAWVMLRTYGRHQLTLGLQDAADGREDVANRRLVAVAGHPLVAKRVRLQACLSLGQLALQRADHRSALNWFSRVPDRASALVGLALAHVLVHDNERSWEVLQAALVASDAAEVQAEADGLRVLLVWRMEGREDAQILARRVGEGGGLFVALEAKLRGTESNDGLSSALVAAIPELSA
jgi:hypothetical protein